MNRGIAIVSLIALLLVGMTAGGWFWLQNHVQQHLITELKISLQAEVLLDELWLNLWAGRVEVRNARLQSLSEDSFWKSARFEKISGSFALKDLFADTPPLQVEVDRGEILLQKPIPSKELPGNPATLKSDPKTKPGWPHLELRHIQVRDLSVLAPDIPLIFSALEGQADRIESDSWRGTLKASSLALLNYQFGETSLQFLSKTEFLQVDSYSLQADKGSITGSAKLFHRQPEQGSIRFELRQVPVSMLLPSKWQVIIQGLATGSGDYKGSVFDWKAGQTQAKLTLEEAQLQSLPLLEKLALIPGLAEKSGVKLDQARSDLLIKDGKVVFSNLAVTRTQRFSWQGQITIQSDNQIEGATMLGVPAGAVSLIPPLKEKIFNTEQDGYVWTPVKISGTADKIEEDLSPRLIALAQESGGKTLEQGKSVLDEGVKKAGELIDQLLK